MENLESIELEILLHMGDNYRKVWLQRTNRPNKFDVVVTLFPNGWGNYQIISLRNLREISFQEIFTGIQREINSIEPVNYS